MKTKMLLLFLLVNSYLFPKVSVAQDFSEANFYGVDYAKCKVLGASESAADFLSAFLQINELFVKEPSKYDVSKFLKKKVCQFNVSPGKNLTKELDSESLFMDDCQDYILTQDDLQAVVSDYEYPESEGVGIIMVCAFLDKVKGVGKYYTCYFDLATRQMLMTTEAWGAAGGFGLRNYWAKSVLAVLKQQKKMLALQMARQKM